MMLSERIFPLGGFAVRGLLLALPWLVAAQVQAGEVQIQKVRLVPNPAGWTAHVTLRHTDTGWEHYADGWRLVSDGGEVLGHRTLHHPHVGEQPFTRSLSDITVPAQVKRLMVEAHDTVHGWSADRVMIDLGRAQGERYRIEQR